MARRRAEPARRATSLAVLTAAARRGRRAPLRHWTSPAGCPAASPSRRARRPPSASPTRPGRRRRRCWLPSRQHPVPRRSARPPRCDALLARAGLGRGGRCRRHRRGDRRRAARPGRRHRPHPRLDRQARDRRRRSLTACGPGDGWRPGSSPGRGSGGEGGARRRRRRDPRPPGAPRLGDLPQRASLGDLADQVVAALPTGRAPRPGHRARRRLAVHRPRRLTGLAGDLLSAVSSSARSAPCRSTAAGCGPDADAREPDPAIAAGRDLARLLAARGVTVEGTVRPYDGARGGGRRWLARCCRRQWPSSSRPTCRPATTTWPRRCCGWSASRRGRPGSFTAGTTAVPEVLDELGVPTERPRPEGRQRAGPQLRDRRRSPWPGCCRSPPTARTPCCAAAHRPAGGRVLGHPGRPVQHVAERLRRRRGAREDRDADRGEHPRRSDRAGRPNPAFVVMSDHVPTGGTLAARRPRPVRRALSG